MLLVTITESYQLNGMKRKQSIMKIYENPKIELLSLSMDDIITTSSGRNPIETEEDIFSMRTSVDTEISDFSH